MAEPSTYLLELDEKTEQRVDGLTLHEVRGVPTFSVTKELLAKSLVKKLSCSFLVTPVVSEIYNKPSMASL